jgi:hypothetical protein
METSSGRFKLTVNCQGTELQGNCGYGKDSMIVFLNSPRFYNRILLSATVALPAVQDSEQIEKRAKDMLVELYTDYKRLVFHKKDLKNALIEFDRKRDLLMTQNGEAEANTLLSGMIQDIIGKKCCIDDLEKVTENIAFELD